MKPEKRGLVTLVAGSILMIAGAALVVYAIVRSYDLSGQWWEIVTDYVGWHETASAGVILMAAGLSLLPFYFLNRESPLWMKTEDGARETKRSALIVSIGVGLTALGFGTSLVMLHLNYAVPPDADAPHRWLLLALDRAILGAIGTGVLVIGFFYRVPDLEFGDEKTLFRRRPLWQGSVMIALGCMLTLATLYYTFSSFEAYIHDDELDSLTTISLIGIITSIAVCLVGLVMIGNRAPSIRPSPFPYEPSNGQKR